MPYILSPIIKTSISGKWGESFAYKKNNLYHIEEGKLPPVNYDEHVIRSHSLTHAEFPLHTQKDGKSVENYIGGNFNYFWGECLVLKIKPSYKKYDDVHFVHEITKEELVRAIDAIGLKANVPKKIIITTSDYPENSEGFHDPNHVLILSMDAASYLIHDLHINLYGTSWKSSDFKPGSTERPMHNKLFEKAIVLELLTLNHVPEGRYFLVAVPLLLEGASESPLTPVLFKYDEINN